MFEVSLDLNDDELDGIEEDTRKQSNGNFFFRRRAGRIGASVSWTVAHSNPMQPSQSLIKSLCYPHLFKVTSKAISHDKKYEKTAVETYVSLMSQTHKDFQVKYCGIIGNLRTRTATLSTMTGSEIPCTAQARLTDFVVVVSSTTPNIVESRRPAIHKLQQV